MRLSVALVNWNTTALLGACLRSITAFPFAGEYEIIVVDNNSKDFDEADFRQQFPQVKLIRNPDNAGYARGNNQALAVAVESLTEFMEAHPSAAAAGAKLIRPDGSIDRSLRSFPYPGAIAWEYLGLSRLFPKSRMFGSYRMRWFGYDKTIEVDQPMGSALILNSAALKEIGTMDESFPIFFNEVDLLSRAKQAGWNIYFVPDAVVVHHGASSTKQVRRKEMVRESHQSLLKFYEKHFKGRICPIVYYFTIACIRTSMLLRG